MLSSIQESFIEQSREQGKTIRSSERNYLFYLHWKDTVEGNLFWHILNASYTLYRVYDYETLIKLYIRFNSVPHVYLGIFGIYRDYFDKAKGTLTSEGIEVLFKLINNEINSKHTH